MPTMLEYIEGFAREVGPWMKSTATGGSSTTLLDTKWPVGSSTNQTFYYLDQYLWRNLCTDSDAVRFVDSYTPASGTLTVDKSYTGNPVSTDPYQLHGVFDPVNEVPYILADALKRCMYVTEVTFCPASLTAIRHRFDTSATWLEDKEWILSVSVLQDSLSREDYVPARLENVGVHEQDAQIYLDLGRFNTNQTFYVRCLKPAYYQCAATGGAYGSQSGLSLITDIAPPPVPWVVSAMLVEAWRRFSGVLEPRAKANLVKTREEAAAWFTRETQVHFKPPPDEHPHEVEHWGPWGW